VVEPPGKLGGEGNGEEGRVVRKEGMERGGQRKGSEAEGKKEKGGGREMKKRRKEGEGFCLS